MALLSAAVLALALWLVGAAVTGAGVGLTWRLLAPRVRAWHAVDRGRLVGALCGAPAVVPSVLLLCVLAPGLLGLAVPAVDHCAQHPDHPHLCLVHPSAVLPLPGAVAAVAAFGLAMGVAGRGLASARRVVGPLRALAAASTRIAPGVARVEDERPFAFTFGSCRPRTLVSSGLLRGLDPEQAEVVLAHEAAHARRRDPLRALLAHVGSAAVPPRTRRELLAEHALCAEQSCDEWAARRCGDRLAVARTILHVERLCGATERAALAGSPAAGIAGASLEARVRALAQAPVPRLRVPRGWWLALPVGLALAARPLHHEIEHLLALAIGAR